MAKKSKSDGFAFWLHFAFGAIAGALFGLYMWSQHADELLQSKRAGMICITGGAVFGGLLAGWGREQFWEGFRDK